MRQVRRCGLALINNHLKSSLDPGKENKPHYRDKDRRAKERKRLMGFQRYHATARGSDYMSVFKS